MNFIQIIGSIASVTSIPLAVYLYLKNREAKHTKLRQEITKNVSYQIGEGRKLSMFEIQAIIDSKARENKVKNHSISINEIVEDLVSETIANPMLDSKHKAEIIENLNEIYNRGKILSVIEKYNISYSEFLECIKNIITKIAPNDFELLSKGTITMDDLFTKDKEKSSYAQIFGLLLMLFFTILSLLSTLYRGIYDSIVEWAIWDPIKLLSIGIATSVIIASLASLLHKLDQFFKKRNDLLSK